MAGNNTGADRAHGSDPVERSTKDRIFDVSVDLFAQKGFDAVSMQEIADAVGIKKASLYYHFSSKDEILSRVLDYPMQRLGTIGPQDMGTDEQIVSMGLDRFMATARDVVMTWMEAPYVEKVMRIIFVELYHNDQVKRFYAKFVSDAFTFWEQNFATMARHGLIRPIDPKVLTEEYLSFYGQSWLDYFLFKYGGPCGSYRQEYQDPLDQHTSFLVEMVRA